MSYYEDARRRARRRRSPWNLLLIPSVSLSVGGIWWGIAKGLEALHSAIYPGESLITASNAAGAIVTAVSPLFAAFPLAMLIGNSLVWLVPPARRVLEREAVEHPGTGFREAQRQLFQLSKWLIPIGLGLGSLGALVSWGR